MLIGIEDRAYHSLVNQLVREGHKVLMYVAGIPHKDLWPWKGVTYVHSRSDLCSADFIISSDYPDKNVRADALIRSVPLIGHDPAAIELELDRDLAFYVVDQLGTSLLTPDAFQLTSKKEAIDFLIKNKKTSWVMKQHRDSPLDESDNRTVITKAESEHAYAISLLKQESSPWFDGESGGVRFEQFIEGVEVCWGAMFSNSHPILPVYWCQEYKDAQNGGRSGILTGEVGTLLGVIPENLDCTAKEVFQALGEFLREAGIVTTGMIDFNTIIDPKTGDMYFVEFTVRWGRPTLELQVAMSAPSKRLGAFLDDVAAGYSDLHFPYFYKTGLGVTVYDYGLPFVLSTPNRVPLPFTPPKAHTTKATTYSGRTYITTAQSIQPLFANVSNPKKWNSSASEGRHFVSVGLTTSSIDDGLAADKDDAFGIFPDKALIEEAYAPLKTFHAPGMTWRDDVGANIESVVRAVRTQL